MASCILASYLGLAGLIAAPAKQAPDAAAVAAADPDALYREREDIAKAKQAAEIWARRAAAGKDYDAAWKLARACYYLGTTGPEAERKYQLQRGFAAGKQAAAIEPRKPEGHFWYAATMGTFAEKSNMDGLRYKGDIKSELEKVIALAPGWQSGSAESALGQWYLKVPSMFFMGGDDAKGIQWLRKALTYNPHSHQIRVTLAEALADDKKSREEVKTLLQGVINEPIDPEWAPEDRGYIARAVALLAKLSKK